MVKSQFLKPRKKINISLRKREFKKSGVRLQCSGESSKFKGNYGFWFKLFGGSRIKGTRNWGSAPLHIVGRHSGVMISVLDARSNGPGMSPGWGTVLFSWKSHFTLIVPFSTQVNKWVLVNLLLGVTL